MNKKTLMGEMEKDNADLVLAQMVSKYFTDDFGQPNSDKVKSVSFNRNGKEVIALINGQKYEFSVKLK